MRPISPQPITTKCQRSTVVDRLNRTLRCNKGQSVVPDVLIQPNLKCVPFMSYRCENCGCLLVPYGWYLCQRGGGAYIVGWNIIGSCAIARISSLSGNTQGCPSNMPPTMYPLVVGRNPIQVGCKAGYSLEPAIGTPYGICRCNGFTSVNHNPCYGTDAPPPMGYSVPGCRLFGKILSYSKPTDKPIICFDLTKIDTSDQQ